MPVLEQMNQDVCQRLSREIAAALAPLGVQYGVVIRTGRGKFTARAMSLTLEIGMVNQDGTVQDIAAEHFRVNARRWGMLPEDIGGTFLHVGVAYRLVGSRPRAPRFPLIGTRVSDGKRFCFPVAAVQGHWVTEAPQAQVSSVRLRQRPRTSAPVRKLEME